jgi:hypothetical protein
VVLFSVVVNKSAAVVRTIMGFITISPQGRIKFDTSCRVDGLGAEDTENTQEIVKELWDLGRAQKATGRPVGRPASCQQQ